MVWFGFVDYTGLLCGVGFGGLLLRRLLCLFALFVGFAFWVCFVSLVCVGLRMLFGLIAVCWVDDFLVFGLALFVGLLYYCWLFWVMSPSFFSLLVCW